jgi:hypothetical protein
MFVLQKPYSTPPNLKLNLVAADFLVSRFKNKFNFCSTELFFFYVVSLPFVFVRVCNKLNDTL